MKVAGSGIFGHPVVNPVVNCQHSFGRDVKIFDIVVSRLVGEHDGFVGKKRGEKTYNRNGALVYLIYKSAVVAVYKFGAIENHGGNGHIAGVISYKQHGVNGVFL